MVTLFDVYCEVGGSQNGVVILQKYPEDFNHEPTLKSIAQFTFPCGFYEYVLSVLIQMFLTT